MKNPDKAKFTQLKKKIFCVKVEILSSAEQILERMSIYFPHKPTEKDIINRLKIDHWIKSDNIKIVSIKEQEVEQAK